MGHLLTSFVSADEIFENVTCNYDAIVLELIVYLIIVDLANSENYKQYIYHMTSLLFSG